MAGCGNLFADEAGEGAGQFSGSHLALPLLEQIQYRGHSRAEGCLASSVATLVAASLMPSVA